MRIGVTLPGSGILAQPAVLTALATRAEQLGFESVWVADHIALPAIVKSPYPYNSDGSVPWTPREPWLDPLLALAWIASATKRIRLGTSVLVLPLRNPLAVAKQVATLDVLSCGRVILGIGTGWLREEFELLNQPFSDRVERAKEMIEIMRRCWGKAQIEYEGTIFKVTRCTMDPKPVQGERLPIWAGGSAQRLLAIVAGLCDGWHPSNLSPDEWQAKVQQLLAWLDREKRDRTELVLSVRPGHAYSMSNDLAQAYERRGVDVLTADLRYRAFSTLDEALKDMDRVAHEVRPWLP
jgi:probable F420-dependent oxidoreductase